MATTTLTPASTTSKVALTSTGSYSEAAAAANYPFGKYVNTDSHLHDLNFVSGAVDQVSYTYKKLGGDVLDIELTSKNVYAAYEEAVLEYSYIVNIHQGKSTLPNALGNTTGTFDHDGQLKTLGATNVTGSKTELKYPKFEFAYADRLSEKVSSKVSLGGVQNEYSASISTQDLKQDYDLQDIIYSASIDPDNSGFRWYNKVGKKKILIKGVRYKTPHAMWRFYGYYGGLNSVGNLSTYGMFADDSTFEIIPPWQNKLQAMAYEDAIYTRNSHYSYEIKNNWLRIFPTPRNSTGKIWVRFTVEEDVWDDDADRNSGVDGVSNLNTLPYSNIPYENINSIGKQWIRRFALALTKEMLGQVRGKFASIPIPGNDVTLNASDLLSQAKEEQEKLREELKTILDELTYDKLSETQSTVAASTNETLKNVPAGVFIG